MLNSHNEPFNHNKNDDSLKLRFQETYQRIQKETFSDNNMSNFNFNLALEKDDSIHSLKCNLFNQSLSKSQTQSTGGFCMWGPQHLSVVVKPNIDQTYSDYKKKPNRKYSGHNDINPYDLSFSDVKRNRINSSYIEERVKVKNHNSLANYITDDLLI